MAVVWEQHYPGGGVTRIVDDAYRDASPEEIQRRLDKLADTLSIILQSECSIIQVDYELVPDEEHSNTK